MQTNDDELIQCKGCPLVFPKDELSEETGLCARCSVYHFYPNGIPNTPVGT
jgi:hypothetical protein